MTIEYSNIRAAGTSGRSTRRKTTAIQGDVTAPSVGAGTHPIKLISKPAQAHLECYYVQGGRILNQGINLKEFWQTSEISIVQLRFLVYSRGANNIAETKRDQILKMSNRSRMCADHIDFTEPW